MDDREVVIQGKHEDHATYLHQRVTHDVHSAIQLLLIIDHHVQPKNQGYEMQVKGQDHRFKNSSKE